MKYIRFAIFNSVPLPTAGDDKIIYIFNNELPEDLFILVVF
jgi:hypothetical protein